FFHRSLGSEIHRGWRLLRRKPGDSFDAREFGENRGGCLALPLHPFRKIAVPSFATRQARSILSAAIGYFDGGSVFEQRFAVGRSLLLFSALQNHAARRQAQSFRS